MLSLDELLEHHNAFIYHLTESGGYKKAHRPCAQENVHRKKGRPAFARGQNGPQ